MIGDFAISYHKKHSAGSARIDISDKSKGLLRQLNEGAVELEKVKREEEAAKRQKQQKAMLTLAEKVKKNENKCYALIQI